LTQSAGDRVFISSIVFEADFSGHDARIIVLA